MREWNELIPVAEGAAILDIEVKRLLGYMLRNGLGDPIGDGVHVYAGSLEWTRHRLADTSAAVQE